MNPMAGRVADAAIDGAQLASVLSTVATLHPERVVVRFRCHSVTYRQLNDEARRLRAVMRAQRMSDNSAVVGAVFTCVPALAEADPMIIAGVIDETIARITRDGEEFTAPAPSWGLSTGEFDLREVSRRMRL